MPKCIILCGAPCAGKSTWAKSQFSSFKISRDEVRMDMYGHTKYHLIDEKKVSNEFWRRFYYYTEGMNDVIIDNQNVRVKYIDEIIHCLPKGYTIEMKLFPISYKKALRRNIWRWMWTRKWIPLDYLKQCIENYKKIENEPKYLVYFRYPLASQKHMQGHQ